MAGSSRKTLGGVFAIILLLCAGCSTPTGTVNLTPVTPQPDSASMKPGLAVRYVSAKVRDVDAIEAIGGGTVGRPLPQLNYHSGTGFVLTSNYADFVGAKIRGFINFEQPGRWLMTAESNDGVRVRLNDQVIIEDPGVHADQFSNTAELNVAAAGWYKLEVTYFERKSTSTLKLYWQRPDSSEFEIVPAAAFGYLP
jgi:PA14 domain